MSKEFFSKLIDALSVGKAPVNPSPQANEVWETRNGKYRVFVLLVDGARPNHQFPVQGVVMTEDGEYMNDFKYQYPRFHVNGAWGDDLNQQTPLDLVKRIS